MKILSKILIVILCLQISFSSFGVQKTHALTATQLKAQQDAYAAQAAQARALADQKKKDAAQVAGQITVLSSQIDKTTQAIDQTSSQISNTEKAIADLESQIKTEEDNLASEKSKMGDVVSSWYMEDETTLLDSVLSSTSLSEMMKKHEYYDSVKQQIISTMDKIDALKKDLEAQKQEQNNQMAMLSGMKENQQNQQENLSSQKDGKQYLLSSTNNAIAYLNKQAQEAESKAQEIRTILAAIYSSGSGTPRGSQMVSSVDDSWYYNQKNYSTVLSPSRLTIAEVGCLITSMAMISTYYGKGKTPPDMAAASAFNTAGSWLYFDGNSGISVTGSSPINWNTVNSELDNGHPVIVSVKVNGPVYNSDGSNHFIVIKGFSNGKYLIHDPYWTTSSYDLGSVKSMKIVRSN